MAADDEIRARVRHCLRPGELVVVRTEGVLRAPVREDDDEIRRLLCLLDAAADRFLTGKHIDHPALFGHGVVEAVSEVQHGDADAVFLDDGDRLGISLRVMDAERGDLRICLVDLIHNRFQFI